MISIPETSVTSSYRLYITSLSKSDSVAVTIDTSNSRIGNLHLHAGESRVHDLSSSLLDGFNNDVSQINSRALIIRSTPGDIVVQLVSNTPKACGAYTVPGTAALGTDFRAMAWWPRSTGKNRGSLSVTATEDNTQVTVNILKGRGVSFDVSLLLRKTVVWLKNYLFINLIFSFIYPLVV